MTELIVDRLTASAPAADAPRVRRLMSALANSRLDDALFVAALPPGDWCLRRVDVAMSLDPDRTDATVTGQWAQALVSALARRMSQGDADVVHYPRPVDGLADLLAGAAVGRVEREWAWRRVGVLGPGDPSPLGSPRAAAIAAARRRPELALAALPAAVDRVGVAALHRMFTADGWAELGSIVLAVRGEPTADRDDLPPYVNPDLVAGIRARSRLAADFRRARGRLRVDPVTARAWAALVVAEAEPALAARPNATAVLAALAACFESAPARASRVSTGADATVDDGAPRRPLDIPDGALAIAKDPPPVRAGADQVLEPATSEDAAADPVGRGAAATDAAGTDQYGAGRDAARREDSGADDADRGVTDWDGPGGQDTADRVGSEAAGASDSWPDRLSTGWAGLLFLLSTAARAGIPDDLLTHDALAGQPLSWALYHIGRLLVPAQPDDPALFALAGVAPGPVPLRPEPATVSGAAEALARQAARWAAATVERLGADGDPAAVTAGIAARDGAISVWPGWMEIHLPLDGVDVDVRRAGLDVDPGWVPWLGTVVVFRYE